MAELAQMSFFDEIDNQQKRINIESTHHQLFDFSSIFNDKLGFENIGCTI